METEQTYSIREPSYRSRDMQGNKKSNLSDLHTPSIPTSQLPTFPKPTFTTSTSHQTPKSPTATTQTPKSPTSPHQTPKSPTAPTQTPKSPTSPHQTPKSPTSPPQTPKSPTSPHQTPKSPTSPHQTPKSPTSPPQTPKSPTSPPQTPKNPTSSPQTPKCTTRQHPPLSPQQSASYITPTNHQEHLGISSRTSFQDNTGYENLNAPKSNDHEVTHVAGPRNRTGQYRIVFNAPRFEIDVLLIGKTGQGKSALGNTILGRRVFKSVSSSTSVTKSVTYELVEYKGRVIKVVDGPGVGDTDLTDEESQNLIVNSLSEAISINHVKGYHAFLLVVKFGERYTKECRMTVDVLKKVFGANFVKNFVILVMTYGDLLEDESFRDWLDEQKGNLKELVKECNNRVILFDNKTKDKIKRDEQIDALLDLVQMLALKNGRYTDKHFDQVKLSRESLTVESEKILIKEEFMQEAILILKTLQLLQADTENINSSQTDKALEKLSVRTNTLLEKLKTKDKNTGILFELISHFQSLSNAIDDETRLVQRICQLIKKKNPDVQRKLSDKIRYQKSVFYVSLVEGTSLENTGNQSESLGSSTGDEDNKEIDRMKVQWEKTRELEAEQKEMKKTNTSDLVGTFQSRVRTTLRNSLKEKSKDVKS